MSGGEARRDTGNAPEAEVDVALLELSDDVNDADTDDVTAALAAPATAA